MKNPVLITLNDGKNVEIGDPFILRHNGKYYLYPSTCDEIEGIRCFVSDDLVNFKEYGLVAKSPILKYAYAPEVIYKDGEFIMATSPRGQGHYFLKSNSPLGPFYFVTENIQNMIDGGFVNDKNNQLHFIRADHNGIAFLDVKNNKLVNRKDILPQVSNAWTEGPSITYFKDRYYATFCGNDVLSENYRIKLGVSKYLDKEYRVQHTPLLLSTKENYSALGHNSIVLGPSMDEYFVAYHKLDWVSSYSTTRYLCLDRLYFNNYDCACNCSSIEITNPRRPDFECYVNENNKLEKIDQYLLSNVETTSKFTAEFNVEGKTNIITSYKDSNNYVLIKLEDFNIKIINFNDGNEKLLLNQKIKFNFNHFHSLRLINDIKCEILIDNVPLFKIKKLDKGKIGYQFKENGLYYTAFTNSTYSSSLKDLPFVIPGKIEANYLSENLFNNDNEIFSTKVLKNQQVTFKVVSESKKRYKLFARMKNKSALISVCSNQEMVISSIIRNKNEYEFSSRYLGEIEINSKDQLTIKVLKGQLEFQYLMIEEVIEEDKIITQDDLNKKGELYLLSKPCYKQTLTFKKTTKKDCNLFGLIVNGQHYCSWRSVKDIKYHGYFVGFENDLIVVDYVQYDRTRIYDKPYKVKRNKIYKLQAEFLENTLNVYVNDVLEIQTSLKYDVNYGLGGVFKSKLTNVKLLSYKEDD